MNQEYLETFEMW